MQWTVLIPAKSLPGAKSRLRTASDADAHARLVHAIRDDTVTAARAAGNVARVVLVTDRADAAGAHAAQHVVVQSAPGLNPALQEAASIAASRWPTDGVAALVGDLPALRPDELAAALDQAAAYPRAYVADAHGTGTTLLTAGPHTALEPEFGTGSAARHAVSAVPLSAGPGLRHDVDTGADLNAAAVHGLGPRTQAVIPATHGAEPR